MENNDSKKWKHPHNRQELLRHALVMSMGYTKEDLDKPVIGIINTWGETNPGHYHFRQLSEAVLCEGAVALEGEACGSKL